MFFFPSALLKTVPSIVDKQVLHGGRSDDPGMAWAVMQSI
jgi:hypothetical protein